MKKLLMGLGAILVALVAIVLVRTAVYSPTAQSPAGATQTPRSFDPQFDAQQIAGNLSRAIQFQTVSSELQEAETQAQFEQFLDWLAATYPQVHSALEVEQLGIQPEQPYTRLFTWTGSDPSLQPVMFSAHYDVVPVIPDTEDEWQHPPYNGTVDDTHIWGRGALDDKSAAIALMEAATQMLAEGFQPRRTLYIALTNDEEIGGPSGTAAVVKKFKNENVQLAWTLDEGSFVLRGFVPGVDRDVASINVAEKGFLTLDLVARGEGGHSSMPPRETAVDTLASALMKLQASPIAGGLEGLSAEMFDAIAPYMSFEKRMLFANRWLFGGLIDRALSANQGTAAMLHTTVAPTMLRASVKENVLPIEAVATINFRLHPRDTEQTIVDYLNATIDDPRVTVQVRDSRAPSRVSSTGHAGYHGIEEATHSTHNHVITAPGLTVAGTDSRRYQAVADDNYRFNPMVVTRDDIKGFHGTNERITIDNMVKAARFYSHLMETTGNP
ncbi:M20 family peptidase [Microbulbifer celer]|uniref:M20 family peptidase n=1 Tax=Microbulbifer celer TaxID=435905 RepID=A0ABW3UEP5_9GAMM|nr:M20 family peptidase [Microbulbifer celer]UFN56019.1 M20 family peptidase [Microbulbifer celer]